MTGSRVIELILLFVGLEFTAWQWIALLLCTPAAVSFYMLPDIWAITRHYKPIGEALSRLERGEELSRDLASAALVRALVRAARALEVLPRAW